MKYTLLACLLALCLTLIPMGAASAQTILAPGAIWTTLNTCGEPEQDINHYNHGDWVYINGSGFDPGEYLWEITGQPGGASQDPGVVVAHGLVTIGDDGKFCIIAYQVADDDWGEYSVKVGTKGDNYRVEKPTAVLAMDMAVFMDLDRDGSWDWWEPAASNWNLDWVSSDGTSGSVTTDASGQASVSFDISAVEMTSVTVTNTLPDGWSTAMETEQTVVLNFLPQPVLFGVYPTLQYFLPTIMR